MTTTKPTGPGGAEPRPSAVEVALADLIARHEDGAADTTGGPR
jgi:hypothetical protein